MPRSYRCLEFGKIMSGAERISFTAGLIWKSVMPVILVILGNFRQLHRSSPRKNVSNSGGEKTSSRLFYPPFDKKVYEAG